MIFAGGGDGKKKGENCQGRREKWYSIEISHLHFLEFSTASHAGFLHIRTKHFKSVLGKNNRAWVCIYIQTYTWKEREHAQLFHWTYLLLIIYEFKTARLQLCCIIQKSLVKNTTLSLKHLQSTMFPICSVEVNEDVRRTEHCVVPLGKYLQILLNQCSSRQN